MADCWFRMIGELNKKELSDLKNDMRSTTWIGEYIGNV
jgi:hypothetical protein